MQKNPSLKRHYLKRFLSFLTAILVIFPFTILDSFAVGDAFLNETRKVSNVVNANGGKAFAAFAVVGSGIGFFTGRVS